MPTGVTKRLAYFRETAASSVSSLPTGRTDIHVKELRLGADDENWSALHKAHGYHSVTRSDSLRSKTGAQWLPDAAFVARCPDLLAVCVVGAGYDIVDLDACSDAGIIVCNQSGAGKEAVAEHAFGFMIALSKKIGLADHVIRRASEWDRSAFKGNDLLGKTVGIIGYGQIGARLAELCRVFEMRVLAFDPYLTAQQIAQRGALKVEMNQLLESADFVSLNGPLTSETRGMFGQAEFARMKKSAFFVTTARGGVHDEAALVDALRRGDIAGAGVDVFAEEPPPLNHPLFAFDNVIATPHTAGITVETSDRLARAAAAQWLEICDGSVPARLINPQAWPKYRARFKHLIGVEPVPLDALPREPAQSAG